MNKKDYKLKQEYNWLNKKNTVEEYLQPDYYKNLLKVYSFNGKTDLEILKDFSKKIAPNNILELGCGSGRASKVIVRMFPNAKYVFLDLSKRMLSFARKEIKSNDSRFVTSDTLEYMRKTDDVYDFVYTLWSFSHSTHQHLHRLGKKNGKEYLSNTLKKFIQDNMSSGGSFFLIHFDSMSEEQSVLMRQWKRVFKIFSNIKTQSPSKRIIDEVLLKLDYDGIIDLSIAHLKGDQIKYKNIDNLLETFMNFHLETYFNKTKLAKEVIDDIQKQVSRFKNEKGNYLIRPGCYVYTFTKKI